MGRDTDTESASKNTSKSKLKVKHPKYSSIRISENSPAVVSDLLRVLFDNIFAVILSN